MKTSLLTLLLMCLLLTACHQQQMPEAPPAPEAPPTPEATPPAETPPVASVAVATQATSEMAMQRSERLLLKAHPGFHMDQFPVAAAGERYLAEVVNGIKRVTDEPVSTFSIDVDTGSYSNIRRMLNLGQLPPAEAVRVEEVVNYFSYGDPGPGSASEPLALTTELAPSPFADGRHLLRIGLKAHQPAQLKARNLVFLVDVSGSMRAANKLPLAVSALKLLVDQLSEVDRLSLVTYAGAASVVLDGASGDSRSEIVAALNSLGAGGSTHGHQGLQEAYRLAEKHFIADGNNRVVLVTDGDFNVGVSDHETLMSMIGSWRDRRIALTALGFGMGNYNEPMLERLADEGNGNHAYIDNMSEARKVLVEEADATLETVAADVKIQIEFNPAVVSEYRLIGYENRLLEEEDFSNDKVDAGELGSGHSITALYELVLAGSGQPWTEPRRYESGEPTSKQTDEIAWLKWRYKLPGEDASQRRSQLILKSEAIKTVDMTSVDFRLAAAAAGYALKLKGDVHVASSYGEIRKLAGSTLTADTHGYRHELIRLIDLADSLSQQLATR